MFLMDFPTNKSAENFKIFSKIKSQKTIFNKKYVYFPADFIQINPHEKS
jgi:hypothetical protein